MARSSATIFLLVLIAFLVTVSFATEPCPNKCLPSRREAVAECKKGSLRSNCAVKRCQNRRKWRCVRKPGSKLPSPSPSETEGACTPLDNPNLIGDLECFDLAGCGPIVYLKEKVNVIACICDGKGIFDPQRFNSGGVIISGFEKGDDTTCFENCIKEKACLHGACTPGGVPGNAFAQCSAKFEIFSQNIANMNNQNDCCERCGGSMIVKTMRGEDFMICDDKTI